MPSTTKRHLTAAWAVHAFTTSGVVLGFLAMVATLEGDTTGAFLWLGLALFVDGIDGTLARRVRTSEVIPTFDGSTLDHIVDYFTYVIIPALMVWTFGMVPSGYETPAAAMMLAVSCYTFADLKAKTHDYYFVGFPALWNLVVLYFHILQSNPWTNLAVLVVCALLTFIPIKFVHPIRVRKWRTITLPVTIVWAATSCRLLAINPDVKAAYTASPLVFWLWCGASLYFMGISLWRSR